MAAKSDSDIESDAEFEDVLGMLVDPEPFSCDSIAFLAQLHSQFSNNRLDRINDLIVVLRDLPDHKQVFMYLADNVQDWIGNLTALAFEYMTAEGRSAADFLRLIFRHFGETISHEPMKSAALLAVFHRDTDSLQLLRETFGKVFVEKAIEDIRNDSIISSRLLWASEHDDIADFKGFLTPVFEVDVSSSAFYSPDEHLLWKSKCVEVIEKIAGHGRADLVEVLLAELQNKLSDAGLHTPLHMDLARQLVLYVAIRMNNFALASCMLSAMCITWNQRGTPAIFTMLLSCCAVCTVEFLEQFLLWVRASTAKDGHQMNPLWFGEMLSKAIQLRKLSHLEMLLDEIDRLGNLFEDFSWFPGEVLRTKSTAILRIILLRYPKASINDKRFDPAKVLREYHWTVGARLLVEAGATIKGKVPHEHAALFKLSLEDRCRIVVRRNVNCPLVQNVPQLPLPGKVKRRFLYR